MTMTKTKSSFTINESYPLGGSTMMALGLPRSEEIRVFLWVPFSFAT